MIDADSMPTAPIRAESHPSFRVRPCHSAIVLLLASPLYLLAPADTASERQPDRGATLVQLSPGLDSLSAREVLPPGLANAGHGYLDPIASRAGTVEPIPEASGGLLRRDLVSSHDGP